VKNTGMDDKFLSSHCGVVKYVGLQGHDISLHEMNYLSNDMSHPLFHCYFMVHLYFYYDVSFLCMIYRMLLWTCIGL